ncbi:hypothetical protein RHSIM_RhsimUnG0081000 [Rhododendron simsii]|uniref:Endonuclease/exonuclease/phosphatase domain-containing protein n=1 Tax=Rhododendron simsii TaxID=118357 RepID=A0A834FW52_RHOSS|nr:hypothetical protein RHSIM_RhsimUnG0081000 [Rhododendron simsii]
MDYFVTEPSDSPKGSSIGPNCDSSLKNQTQPLIEEISPAASPTSSAQPNPMDLTLASAFNTLNIKRKAHDDLPDPGKSKILKLCGPDPNPIPKPVTPRSYRKGGRGGRSQAIGGKRNLNPLLNVEQNLCDVNIQQAYTDSMVAITMVPIGETQRVVENPDGVLIFPEPEGLAGGLALWWNKDVDIEVEGSSKNLIQTVVSESGNQKIWAASFVYGSPSRAGRPQVWDELKSIARGEILPWLCIGDFNEILSVDDKIGVGLEFKGPTFTWRNKRSDGNFIMERLDMAFANSKWRELFDQAMVFIEAAVGSDHNPIILNTEFPLNKVGKPFRFESFWTAEEECRVIISEAWSFYWEGSHMFTLCKKLKGCKDKLKEWSQKKFGDLRLQIAMLKDQLVGIQKQLEQGFNPECIAVEKELTRRLEDLWQKDSMFWHQRSRIKWLQMGDRNSRFFHLSTIQRRQRN